jgi:hypothetical protein
MTWVGAKHRQVPTEFGDQAAGVDPGALLDPYDAAVAKAA